MSGGRCHLLMTLETSCRVSLLSVAALLSVQSRAFPGRILLSPRQCAVHEGLKILFDWVDTNLCSYQTVVLLAGHC